MDKPMVKMKSPGSMNSIMRVLYLVLQLPGYPITDARETIPLGWDGELDLTFSEAGWYQRENSQHLKKRAGLD